MGRPIEIQIDTKVKDAGLTKTADGLEKVSDALDDVATDAKTSGRQTERALDGIADEAKDTAKAADKLDRDLTKALDSVSRESKRAGDELGRNVKRGADEASEGVETLNENAGSNAKEIAASFDGSFESMADGLQGFIAESLEGFGAIGLAGGVGIALALGIGLNALNEMAEEANALTEDAADLADAIAGVGSKEEAVALLRDRFVEVTNEIGDARSAWELWQDRAVTKGEQLADAIRQGSLSAGDLTAAFTESDPVRRLEAMSDVAADLQRNIDATADAADRAGTSYNTRLGPAASRARRELVDNVEVSKAAKDILDDEIATQEASIAILEARATALGVTTDELLKMDAATADAQAAQESLTSALADAADPVSVYTTALGEASTATTQTVDDMIAEWNRQAEEADTFQANLEVIAATGAEALAAELRSQGPEAAAATADLLANAGSDKIRAAADAYGRANGSQLAQGTAAGITGQQQTVQTSVDELHKGIRVPSLHIPVALDDTTARRQIEDLIRPRSVPINYVERRGTSVP